MVVVALGLQNANAQEKSTYNKWSIDLNGGLTKTDLPMTDGYYIDTFGGFYHVDGGIRYMFNNKFGIKADFGFDRMKNGKSSKPFQTNYYRTNLQGVLNLGRVLGFEDWTSVLGLQAHAGLGYSWMTPGKADVDPAGVYNRDAMMNAITGLTGQIKLGSRVALNADFSVIKNIQQDKSFDGMSDNLSERTFDGLLYNATLGLSFYLGGAKQHADWYSEDKNVSESIASLSNRVANIENNMLDSDNDGVADYLDVEPNTPAGTIVDTKGRSLDKNKNGIPDSYESYFAEHFKNNSNTQAPTFTKSDSDVAAELINNGYVATYFDFDKSKVKNTEAITFLITYLRSNPSAKVEVNGFADSIGSSNYNNRLSEKRAKSVAKLLEQAGVSSSRIRVNAKGIDNSVDGRNQNVSKFARKVTFKVY